MDGGGGGNRIRLKPPLNSVARHNTGTVRQAVLPPGPVREGIGTCRGYPGGITDDHESHGAVTRRLSSQFARRGLEPLPAGAGTSALRLSRSAQERSDPGRRRRVSLVVVLVAWLEIQNSTSSRRKRSKRPPRRTDGNWPEAAQRRTVSGFTTSRSATSRSVSSGVRVTTTPAGKGAVAVRTRGERQSRPRSRRTESACPQAGSDPCLIRCPGSCRRCGHQTSAGQFVGQLLAARQARQPNRSRNLGELSGHALGR